MTARIRELDFPLQNSHVRKINGVISGIVLSYGKPVAREVVVYRRHDQLEVARTTSNATTGIFSVTIRDNVNNYYRVVVIASSLEENSQIQDFIQVVIS